MSDGSAIEWTDATWNPVRGCVKVSPGCKHCYAETFAERWRGLADHPYGQGFDLRLVPEKMPANPPSSPCSTAHCTKNAGDFHIPAAWRMAQVAQDMPETE